VTAFARDVIEVGKAVFDQSQPPLRRLHHIGAGGDSGLVTVDTDHLAVRGSENRRAVTAGAESPVDIDAAIPHVEEFECRHAEHRHMPGHAAVGPG
jgi:hypothetical protein